MLFRNKKVLVCDDERLMRALVATHIRSRAPELEIVQVSNGKEAEQALRSEQFEFVFLDVEMPVQDGFTTLGVIRKEELAENTPIVLCTGRSKHKDMVRGLSLKADYYLTKPFYLDDLGAVLDALFDSLRVEVGLSALEICL